MPSKIPTTGGADSDYLGTGHNRPHRKHGTQLMVTMKLIQKCFFSEEIVSLGVIVIKQFLGSWDWTVDHGPAALDAGPPRLDISPKISRVQFDNLSCDWSPAVRVVQAQAAHARE